MSEPVEEPAPGSDLYRPLALAVTAAAVAVGIWWRVQGLASLPLYGDEYHGARIAQLEYGEIFHTYDKYGTHVPLPLLQHLVAMTFEPGVYTFRLPAVVAGILTLLLCYPIATSLFGRTAGVLATVALSLSPVHLYYSRFGRAYAITIFLGLVLLGLLARAQRAGWRGPGVLTAIAVVAALIPWTHLSGLGMVVGTGLTAMGLAWADGGRRAAIRIALVFVGAAALCALLFTPVFEQVLFFAGRVPQERRDSPLGPFGITTVLAGGGIAGLVWLVGLPLATALAWKSRRTGAALAGASVLGALALLLILRPHGMGYAWARYLVIALPGMLMLLSWLVVRLVGPRWGPNAACAFGLVAILAVHLTGPISPGRTPDGPFSNTYLALRALPAFDRGCPCMPELYRQIAEDPEITRIVEAPILHSRAVLLYRNYYLYHGKEVLIGLVRSPDDVRLNGPYAFVGSPTLGRDTGAQLLIVHKDLLGELAGYWRFVYEEVLPGLRTPWDAGLMQRHYSYFVPEDDPKGMVDAMVPALRAQLKEPFYEDDLVIAWKLRQGRGRRKAGS